MWLSLKKPVPLVKAPGHALAGTGGVIDFLPLLRAVYLLPGATNAGTAS